MHYDPEQQAIVGPTRYEAAVSSMVGMGLMAIEAPMGAAGELGTSTGANSVKFANKFPDDPVGPANLVPLDRLTEISGRFNYVVLEDGQLLVGKGGHIDIAGGQNVLAAGEVKVVKGEVKYIDNASGHYLPEGASARQNAESAFNRLGYDITDKYVEKIWIEDPSLPRGGAWRPKE